MDTPDYGESFGPWLKRMLAEVGINQRTLSLMIGASSGMVSGWSLGHRRPTPEYVAKIAQALGVSEEEALVRAGYRRPRDTDLHPQRARLLEIARQLPLSEAPLVIDYMIWRTQQASRPRPHSPQPPA